MLYLNRGETENEINHGTQFKLFQSFSQCTVVHQSPCTLLSIQQNETCFN